MIVYENVLLYLDYGNIEFYEFVGEINKVCDNFFTYYGSAHNVRYRTLSWLIGKLSNIDIEGVVFRVVATDTYEKSQVFTFKDGVVDLPEDFRLYD